MKLLAVILSIYFLALNVVPCGDDGDIGSCDSIESVVDSDHDVEHNDCGICSPFCQCQCYHSHTLIWNSYGLELVNPIATHEKRFFHCEGFSEDLVFTLLQPPKLVG
ncbi:MAG: DUF6660 family protein [Bacteroidota bacterium]